MERLIYKCNYDGKICDKVIPKIDDNGVIIPPKEIDKKSYGIAEHCTKGENLFMNKIYVLKSCNAWKSYDSTRDIVYTTNLKRLKEVVEKELEENNMEYDGDFSSDFDKLINDEYLVNYINMKLIYGYLICSKDGEIL